MYLTAYSCWVYCNGWLAADFIFDILPHMGLPQYNEYGTMVTQPAGHWPLHSSLVYTHHWLFPHVHVCLSAVIFIYPVLVYSVFNNCTGAEKNKGWQASRTSSCTLNQAPSSCRFNYITYSQELWDLFWTRIVGTRSSWRGQHKCWWSPQTVSSYLHTAIFTPQYIFFKAKYFYYFYTQ